MVIIQLKDIFNTEQEINFQKAISAFTCKDKDVELFLKNKSVEFEKRNKSRTYLIMNEEELYNGNFVILAYFTLSLKALSFRDNVSNTKKKEIDGFSKNVQAVATILIGQFGKDLINAKNVQGEDLFKLCLKTIYKIHNLIGSRIVLLECQDIQKIKSFYEKNEFYFLQYDENDKYLQMIKNL